MKILLTSDLHLTDKPADAYRFDLFPWLMDVIESRDIGAVFLLGDLTDYKNNHSAELVNSIADRIKMLTSLKEIEEGGIHILKGNHDFSTPLHPFFEFLQYMPGVFYYVNQKKFTWEDRTYLFLPSTKHPERDWNSKDFRGVDFVLMHQTVDGSVASNGFEIESEFSPDPNFFGDAEVFSGDIHVPQTKGPIVYCGAPYRIRFGDTYVPRILVIDSESHTYESIQSQITIKKHSLKLQLGDELDEDDLIEGDQATVEIESNITDHDKINSYKKGVVSKLESFGVSVHGVRVVLESKNKRKKVVKRRKSDKHILREFAESEGISGATLDAGLSCLGVRQ